MSQAVEGFKHEVHLGRVIYGKTTGGLHKKRKAAPFRMIPRENWIVVENAHPAVKTPEEHAEIVTLLESRRIQPKLARRGTYLLSGLLYCGKCGYSLQFQPKPDGRTLVKKCQKTDAFGNSCTNRGIELEHVEKAVMESLREHEAELLKTPVETGTSEIPTEHLLHTKEKELESLRDWVNRLKDLYVMGDVTKAEYKTRLERLKDLIVKKENEYEQLKESLDGCSPLTHAERLQLIDELKASWTTVIDVKERNRLMKLIIERTEYSRNGDEVNIHVKYR
ncbi:recombinase zinc beta ribbon domain-containing protein [Alicyclobacillus acidiphilus]|uniref:recombinase zinc beta ribbon domain-containing protein n=1 Tax=Alicyclobacillus acidiphilus TaxID=182455 RepID=UPI000831458D|nr:recombinase zinc beta ribbon domain-containing protein [Alicyclobacillus acidiphilus]